MERTHLTSDMFNLYLHQNYLEFFSDMDDLVGANLYSHIQDTCFSFQWSVIRGSYGDITRLLTNIMVERHFCFLRFLFRQVFVNISVVQTL